MRNLTIMIGHWILHCYGIISLTELKQPDFHVPLLLLVFFPVLFYVCTTKFTNPDNLDKTEWCWNADSTMFTIIAYKNSLNYKLGKSSSGQNETVSEDLKQHHSTFQLKFLSLETWYKQYKKKFAKYSFKIQTNKEERKGYICQGYF